MVQSKAAFKSQLLEAGVPAAQVDAAIAHAEKKGPIKAGLEVSIPDRFTRQAGDKRRRAAVGDLESPARAPASGGRKMGTLSIHTFDDVPPSNRRAGRVDACGSSELMIGAGFPGIDACGGSSAGGETPTPARRRRAPANFDGCGASAPALSTDACGGSAPSARTRRRTTPSAAGCGSEVRFRGNHGGAC